MVLAFMRVIAGSPEMKLVLKDGTVFRGRSFGAAREVRGEVVFNTGMVGYVEALTDPSYRGQILVLTYPLQGNYGVPDRPFESAKIQVQGLIVHQHSDRPSHHASTRTLRSWLQVHGVPAMTGVDTRGLTRHLRMQGTIDARLLLDGDERNTRRVPPAAVDMTRVLELVRSPRVTYFGGAGQRVLLIDTGAKETIVRCLLDRGATVTRVPWREKWEAYLDQVDGLVLTNGPGRSDAPRRSDPARAHRAGDARGHPDSRHLSRSSVARASGRCGDRQDEVRASLTQPTGARSRERPRLSDESEPRLRDRPVGAGHRLGAVVHQSERRVERRHSPSAQAVSLGSVSSRSGGRPARHAVHLR